MRIVIFLVLGLVFRIALAADDVVIVASQQNSPSAVIADSTTVFWFNQAEGKIYRKDFQSTKAPQEFANPGIFQSIDVHNLILKDGYLYWGNYSYSKIQRKKVSGGPIEDLASTGAPLSINVDDRYVYWSTYACVINKVERSGAGQVIPLANGYCSQANISTDSDSVFFTASENMKAKVLRMPKIGGEVKIIADGIYNSIYSTSAFENSLVWSDQGGAIYEEGPSVNQPKKLIDDNVVRAVRGKSFIFYVSSQGNLQVIKKYDLRTQAVSTLSSGANYISDMVLAHNRLFWTDKSGGLVYGAEVEQ